MRAELFLARRYLFGLGRRTQVATVTLISLLGLALGVLALVVTMALLEGFQATIRRGIVSAEAHARVSPSSGRTLADPAGLESILHLALSDVEIVAIVRGTCLVTSLTDAVPASVVGRSDTTVVTVDQILSARAGVGVGDELRVISPRQRLTPLGPLPVRLGFVVGELHPPVQGSETGTLTLPLADAQRLLWGRPVVEALELRDAADPWGLGGRVRASLGDRPGLSVEGLTELHRGILLALSLERVMIFLAVGLILVVAALNLLCNVAMIAAEKRQDLAVLAGLGLPPLALRRLFLSLGLAIGGVGAVVGAVAGTILAVVLDATGALPLPRGVFVVSAVPFKVEPAALAAVLVLALALAAAAAWLPSRLVALREPAEGLRYE